MLSFCLTWFHFLKWQTSWKWQCFLEDFYVYIIKRKTFSCCWFLVMMQSRDTTISSVEMGYPIFWNKHHCSYQNFSNSLHLLGGQEVQDFLAKRENSSDERWREQRPYPRGVPRRGARIVKLSLNGTQLEN